MYFRAIVKSVLTVQPGFALRALKNKLKLLVLMVREWPALRAFLQRMSGALGAERFARLGLDCVGVVQWPYISKDWDAQERFDALASHYEVVTRHFPALVLLGREERLALCDLSRYSPACSLLLDRAIWFKREGELVLNLFQGDLRVASLAFTLRRTDNVLNLFIGAVQGIHKGIDSETSLNIYRDLTKDFEGLRPRSLLIEVVKCIARTLGAVHIYAVGDAHRHHRHAYFGAEKAHDLAANYDVIWEEHGATPSTREDFFSLPLAAAQRSPDDIPPKKRAMYRRRQALLDDVFSHVEAVLSGNRMDPHRQRLGQVLAEQEKGPAPQPGWFKAKLAALVRQFQTEPRPDQRFIAYLRKAGLYSTLRKAWRELLKQGPGVLWKPPDIKRKSLALDTPRVAARELFPREVLLLVEVEPVALAKSRPGQIRQLLEGLGYRCRVLDWRNHVHCLNALQTSGAVILHRVPASPQVLLLLDEARRLEVMSCWDSDELTFDPQAYRRAHDMAGLSAEAVDRLMVAVALHRQALLSCDQALASTAELALAMKEAGARQVTLVEAGTGDRETEQVRRLFPIPAAAPGRRVLSANIFFAPRSFGGATVVAEQMVRLMGEMSAWQSFIFTSLPVSEVTPYGLLRYEAHGAPVIGVGLPETRSPHEDFENPATVAVFEQVLACVAPDIVHLHSIQGLGALLANSCRKAGVPFVVTLHDAWWICGRQFMIDKHGQYCGQTTIQGDVCARCVDDPPLNAYRQRFLADTLKTANLLLAPSTFARNLYIANGFDAGKIRINRNGILAPAADYLKHPGQMLRFGFVGGNSSIKGINLITRAFASLERSDYELKVVDNLLHLGFRSFNRHSVKIPGTVSIIPGYTQADIDAFFSGIDVLLFPTQWKETFGLAIREALVRDVWVVSTDAGGTVEDIVDGVNGTIIPLSSDERYLREVLDDILDHPQRYVQHRNRFKDGITLCSDQALELQGIYQDVVHVSEPAGQPSSAIDSLK
nr:DUF535 family protein [Pseudomonas sp. MWU13-3659]